jgi:hypothetical protein
MTIEATIQTLMGALVSGRCYPLINTSTTIVSPYITYQVIHASPLLVTENSEDPERIRLQIDIWATTYGAAKALAASVKAVIDTATAFASALEMSMDMYEDVSKEYRVMIEFYIWP